MLIASRDHLCVNSKVNHMKGFQLNAGCRAEMKAIDPCIYSKNREKASKEMTWQPLDIEELHKEAQAHLYCPYYGAKDRAVAADLIFMPYNYLIDEKIRDVYKLDYTNSIIIFNEAHNIAQCVEDATSFELKTKTLSLSITEVTSLQEIRHQKDVKEWKSTAEGLE